MRHLKWFFSISLCLLLGCYFYCYYQTPEVLPSIVRPAPPPLCIALQPFGQLDQRYIVLAKQELEDFYGVTVRVLDPQPLPDSAYYAPRKRYRAPILLRHLLKLCPDDCAYIAGLTAKDISTTKGKHHDWGILGLGFCPGRSCVVSTHRLKRSARDRAHIATRFAKVVLHEVGHNLGLRHCQQSNTCLMRDACGTIKTIDEEHKALCGGCQRAVAHKVVLPMAGD